MSNYNPQPPKPRRSPAGIRIGWQWLYVILVAIVMFSRSVGRIVWQQDRKRADDATTRDRSDNSTDKSSASKVGNKQAAPSH